MILKGCENADHDVDENQSFTERLELDWFTSKQPTGMYLSMPTIWSVLSGLDGEVERCGVKVKLESKPMTGGGLQSISSVRLFAF